MRCYRLQSATEYLITYSWAFLIAAVVIGALYLFIFAPTALSPSSCTFSSGVYCQDMIFGSSATLSKIAMLLTNTNPYSIVNPKITVNVSGAGLTQGSCVSNFVLPGGAIICNATITPAVSQSTLASGKFVLSYTPCPGDNATACSSNTRQSYPGSFSTHVSPLLSPTTLNITLRAQNSSQAAISTTLDKLTANAKLLGTPVSGATVNFTSNSTNAKVNPSVATTDGSGNAYSYTSSNMTGKVFYTAYFANAIANVIVIYTPPVCYTLSIPSISGATSNAITIDGFGYSSFPQQLCFGRGTTHPYSFQSAVSGGAGIQYVFDSESGCGTNTQSGVLSSGLNCTITGNYITQYYLTTSASPGAGGTITPPSGWYNASVSATLGETPSAGYLFNGWTGSGSGSYTGSNTAPLVVLNNPISETGSFISTSTTTTSSTTTSTTSSTSTSTTSSTSSTSTSSTTTTIPVNPTCGSFVGDITYSASTALTCNILTTGSITIYNGVTIDEHGYYMQADNIFTNSGKITDVYDGGLGGAGGCTAYGCGAHYISGYAGAMTEPGSAGTAGIFRTSAFFNIILSGGQGGGGGGSEGGEGTAASGRCSSQTYVPAGGGSGGNGGGIVEIYAGTFDNVGTIDVSGLAGAPPYVGFVSTGGAGSGGSGGTILIGYASLASSGNIDYSGGPSASGGIACGTSPSSCGWPGTYICYQNSCSTGYCTYGAAGGGGSCSGGVTDYSSNRTGCYGIGEGESGNVYWKSGWHP
ncbi:MAG: hypothetical protein KGH71_03885 [Candidatus Micrarchaeota archaeon]|nr:hypothetical protein [Candidatus Micrarchaeota archaeon]